MYTNIYIYIYIYIYIKVRLAFRSRAVIWMEMYGHLVIRTSTCICWRRGADLSAGIILGILGAILSTTVAEKEFRPGPHEDIEIVKYIH